MNAPLTGAAAVPDSRGLNLYRADPMLARLAALYLPADLHAHLAPHLDRLGALAGDRLDTLASTADRNPPRLHHRTRRGEDVQSIEKHPAYLEMEALAFGEYGLAALSHRGGVLGWPAPMPPAAKYLLTYLFVQAEFGLMCPVSMTDSLTRTLRRFGDPLLPLTVHSYRDVRFTLTVEVKVSDDADPDKTLAAVQALGAEALVPGRGRSLMNRQECNDAIEGTRAFTRRFAERMPGRVPTENQAGVYSSVLAYLRAVRTADSTEGARVIEAMRRAPIGFRNNEASR